MKTLVDLRMWFHNETGKGQYNIDNKSYKDPDYILWLEYTLLQLMNDKSREVTSGPTLGRLKQPDF
jgi:hypothetical protein